MENSLNNRKENQSSKESTQTSNRPRISNEALDMDNGLVLAG